MSGYIAISLLSLLGSVSSKYCPVINCGVLTYPNCYNYDEASSTGIAAECPQSQYCDIETYKNGMIKDDDSPLFHNAICMDQERSNSKGNLPGQYCDFNRLCIDLEGVSCIDGECKGLTKDIPCSSTQQCNPGLYCKTGDNDQKTCSEFIEKAKSCLPGIDICEHGYECGGICRKMFSVESDDQIPGKACNSEFSTLCEKGFCVVLEESTIAICLEAPKIVGSYKDECETCTGQILYENEYIYAEYDCECALNGKKYCPGLFGEEYGIKLFKKMKEFYVSSAIKKCNIETNIFSCMMDFWDKDYAIESLYYSYMASDRMFTYNSDKCVMDRLGYEYLKLKAAYDNIDDSSSSSSSSGLAWLIVGSTWALIA